MGQVWRAEHATRPDLPPLAVKILGTASDATGVTAVRNELRMAAALDHPNVVMLFEHGLVPRDGVQTEDGAVLAGGSQWLAMELVLGGSASKLVGRVSWQRSVELLRQVLDALAHAHARGVLHRDIKPGNVLLGEDGRVKLTDFGLAHALGQVDRPLHGMAGTPNYMAPEQIDGRWRDWGPWTDLYAVGCLAHTLVTGRPPFDSDDLQTILAGHRGGLVPALEPTGRVPVGFDGWLREMLRKDPMLRFRRAADAREGLDALAMVDRVSGIAARRETSWTEDSETTDLGATQGTSLMPAFNALVPYPPAPRTRVAADWRDLDHHQATRLQGLGLSLFGLRALPLVGRERERDVLWDALRTVLETRKPSLVVVRGPVGSGKTRLVQWLAQLAQEAGAVTLLTAQHAQAPGPAHGVGPMIAQHQRLQGLDRAATLDRLESVLERAGSGGARGIAHGLTEMVRPVSTSGQEEGVAPVRLNKPTDRYALVEGYLDAVCNLRPALVWLEDVHWSIESMGLAAHLLWARSRRDLPVLVVVTARDEILEDRPVEAELVDRLVRLEGATSIQLGSMDGAAVTNIVQELLGLEGELASQVQARSAGNPWFAVQLVSDWVQRGVLEASARGFQLKDGEVASLPDDLHQVWRDRTERFLAGRPDSDGRMLEIGASLGREVDFSEWRTACQMARLRAGTRLLEDAHAQGLVAWGPGGPKTRWWFNHALLKESLDRRAQERNRFDAWHTVCAKMLRERFRVPDPERLGLHYARGQEAELAVPLLLEGAEARFRNGDFREADRLLRQREQLMHRLSVPDRNLAWGKGWLLRARVALQRPSYAEARKWAMRVFDVSQRQGWPLAASALRVVGSAERFLGSTDQALRQLHRALDDCEPSVEERAELLHELGALYVQVGRLDEAQEMAEYALEEFEQLERPTGVARCQVLLGTLARQRGELDAGMELTSSAARLFHAQGRGREACIALNALGEICRLRGDLDSSARHYEQALRTATEGGHWEAIYPRINLALIRARRGQMADAQVELSLALEEARSINNRELAPLIHACLLPCRAYVGDWGGLERDLEAAQSGLLAGGLIDVDAAWSAARAARLAQANNAPAELVARLKELARAQWAGLGRSGEPFS